MNSRWTLADLLDLEYLFQTDEALRQQEGEQALRKRDRIIYLAKIAPKIKNTPILNPQELVQRWLQVRQRNSGGAGENNREPLLPGAIWNEVSVVLLWLALFFGLGSGLGLASAFSVYSGRAPLNVSAFLGLFVALQLVILLVQSLFMLLRRVRRSHLERSVLYTLLLRLMIAGADWIYARARRSLSANKRLSFAALLGQVRSRRELAPLLVWPVFFLLQLSAIGFNLGVLGLTLAKVVFSDMAFGWQSSLQLSAQQVADGVRLLALPWSWFLPEGMGYPSLAQVEGTQIILKDGIYHLATQDLVSWWPFLCAALVIYGLLPRLLLLMGGYIRYRHQLDALELRNPEIRWLLQRMTTPQVETDGEHAAVRVRPQQPIYQIDIPQETAQESVAVDMPPATTAEGMHSLILVPEELLDGLDNAALMQAMQNLSGCREIQILQLPFSAAEEQALLVHIQKERAAALVDEVFLVQEAWMPPLQETQQLLAQLRTAVGATTPLTILLIGRPKGNNRLTPALPEHADIWRKKMQALADPSLDTRTLMEAI
ncbi:MAG: DUF2868 domain-containing protein [Desulfobulbus sp.]|jgi:hypothetical protein